MARPLIATKLFVPKLRRGLVARPRLHEHLRRGAGARLTLVSAPAGFGKTTLLADWLGEAPNDDRSVAWLSLDPADNDPSSFWTYVVSALQGAVPGVGSSALELIPSSPMPTDLVLTTLLNDLAATPGEVWLVLDDYHLVDKTEIGQGMIFLLDHLPSHVHVVLSTRADPDLQLARWRVRGELVEIRAADLRFTPDEAASYLNEATGLRLAARDVETLEERTEGWIAALQLAALSIKGRDDASSFIARFAGNDRYIVDYLVEEVLQHQPEPVREFLLRSAVLDRLTGPLCDAVTGCDDGRDMLMALERANLFLVALDDQREWYRYHHLFADVLRARLVAEQPDLASQLHQRASRWYEAHDLAEEAVRHALAARDFDRAANLIELAMSEIRRHRQDAMLFGWLTALPEDTVRRSPVLSVFSGYCSWSPATSTPSSPDSTTRNAHSQPYPRDRRHRGPTPMISARCRRSSPSTVPRSPKHGVMWPVRRNTPGARWTSRGPTTISRAAAPPRSSASPRGRAATCRARWRRSGKRWPACTPPAISSTSSAARWCLRTCGSPPVDPARHASSTSVHCRWPRQHGEPVARATAELHVGLSEIDLEDGRPRQGQAAPQDRCRSRRPCGHDREPLSLVPGDGPRRSSRRRPRRGRQPSGPGRAALPTGPLPQTYGPSRPSRPGSRSRTASWRTPLTGPRNEACRPPTTPAI